MTAYLQTWARIGARIPSVPSLLVIVLFAQATHAQAQVPGGMTSIAGVVTDASSGAPIAGVLVSVDERGPQGLTNAQGLLTIGGVPMGTHRLRAVRFGYRALEQVMDVVPGMAPLALRLAPDPLQLEGLTVMGNAKADVKGMVRDASTNRPLRWSDVVLTRDAVEQVGRRELSDTDGRFEISDVQVGTYLLRVERLGYIPQYVPLLHAAQGEPLDVYLEPDAALTRGLAVMNGELVNRQSSFGHSTMVFGEDRLRESPSADMRDFFLDRRFRGLGSCGQLQTVKHCIFIDDQPLSPASPGGWAVAQQILFSHSPRDFYRVDVFVCTGTAGAQGASPTGYIPVVYAYTHEYVQRVARAPKIPPAVLC